jgi:hypothetical protein
VVLVAPTILQVLQLVVVVAVEHTLQMDQLEQPTKVMQAVLVMRLFLIPLVAVVELVLLEHQGEAIQVLAVLDYQIQLQVQQYLAAAVVVAAEATLVLQQVQHLQVVGQVAYQVVQVPEILQLLIQVAVAAVDITLDQRLMAATADLA